MEKQPLSHAEESALQDFIRNLGWGTTTRIQDELRYSLSADKLCCFCAKKRVPLPIPSFKPWDIVSFKLALAFQIRFSNEDTYNLINFIATNLRNIAEHAQLEHNFDLEGLEGKVIKTIDALLPDGSTEDPEQAYVNLIRVNFLNKYLNLPDLMQAFMQEVPAIAEQTRLHSTLALPWELRDGIPQFRHNNTLTFTNDEGDETLLVEPGFLTFFHDISVNRVAIRVFFETHSPFVLLTIWKDTDFKLAELVTAWVQFARQQLTNLLAIVEYQDFDKNLLLEVKLDRKFLDKGNATVFPLSALALDSYMVSNVSPIATRYFSNPPVSFDELEAVTSYEKGLQFKRGGKYFDAIEHSIAALKIFNRYAQKQGVVLTLINLSDIAKKTQKYAEAEKYLKDALEVCKSGEVDDDLIVHVQQLLGLLKIQTGPPEEAIVAFDTAIKFLETSSASGAPAKRAKVATLRLKLARAYLLTNNPTHAKIELKDALRYAKVVIVDPEANAEFMAQYYIEAAFIAEKRELYSQAVLTLRKAVALDEKITNKTLMVQVFLDLARISLMYRKNAPYSIKMLLRAERILIDKKGGSKLRLIKVYELMSDAYNMLKDLESAHNYRKRAADLRRALKIQATREAEK